MYTFYTWRDKDVDEEVVKMAAENESTPPLFDNFEIDKSHDAPPGLNPHKEDNEDEEQDDDDDIFASAIQVNRGS